MAGLFGKSVDAVINKMDVDHIVQKINVDELVSEMDGPVFAHRSE